MKWRPRSVRIRSSFDLRHIKEPRRRRRHHRAAAEESEMEIQQAPRPRRDQTGDKVSGRGIAYAQRNGTRVAVIAEVDIDRSSGKIWARKFTVAHDCGQIINPDGLVKCIEGNIVQGVSRTLWEEVTFDNKTVTSVDWLSYPILDITETPRAVDAGANQPPGTCRQPAPASHRSAQWRRQSPTRSSTLLACAYAACLSRQIGLNRRCPDCRGKRDLNKSQLAMPSLKQWQGLQAHLRGPYKPRVASSCAQTQ